MKKNEQLMEIKVKCNDPVSRAVSFKINTKM